MANLPDAKMVNENKNGPITTGAAREWVAASWASEGNIEFCGQVLPRAVKGECRVSPTKADNQVKGRECHVVARLQRREIDFTRDVVGRDNLGGHSDLHYLPISMSNFSQCDSKVPTVSWTANPPWLWH
ncbi:hypothetical protein H5410_028139 [Solanum commersonii]|uniref:Uncharacterized protein n=1 Tax=Solanum commersonii TaxID=4109 RepID=A0A9J5Z438_SOLCO|nr:hypothetical protein H5410_028139 [Solanum commersonii]